MQHMSIYKYSQQAALLKSGKCPKRDGRQALYINSFMLHCPPSPKLALLDGPPSPVLPLTPMPVNGPCTYIGTCSKFV